MGHEMYSKDLYNILGIKDAASQEEIKTAFYKVH
jgi:DnaJ-class molecular chaperone